MTESTEHLTRETLSAHADGELNAVASARAERHLSACASCREQLEGIRRLVAAARGLPRAAEPPPEVWMEIRARIARDRAGRPAARWWHNGWIASAAALVLILGTAVLATMNAPGAKAGKLPSVAAVAPPRSTVVLAVDGNYAPTVLELRRTLEAERGALAPHTVRVIERSLAVIDAAIAEARDALAADPANVALVDVLTARYERKVDLLQRATRLSPSL